MVGVISVEVVSRIETLNFAPANRAAINDPSCRIGGAITAVGCSDQCNDALRTGELQRRCYRKFLVATAQAIATDGNCCLTPGDDASGSPGGR